MKAPLFLLSTILFLLISGQNPQSPHMSGLLPLSGDSGYICKRDGLAFLKANALADSLNDAIDLIPEDDRIGKYYKLDSLNYIICLCNLNYYSTYNIFIIDESGKIIAKDEFSHSIHECGIRGPISGFRQYGDFFGVEICGTGSGFCANTLCLFQTLPLSSQGFPFLLWDWQSPGGISREISSKMAIHEDTVMLYYTLYEGKIRKRGNSRPHLIARDTARYVFLDHTWTCTDSADFQHFWNY